MKITAIRLAALPALSLGAAPTLAAPTVPQDLPETTGCGCGKPDCKCGS